MGSGRIKEYFEQHSIWKEEPSLYQIRVITAVTALLGEKPGTILEIGPGRGFLKEFLDANVEFAQYSCVDFAVNVAGRAPGESVVANLAALPFDNQTFDVAIATDVLEHVPDGDYAASIEEVFRVSAKSVIIATPFLENLQYARTLCPRCGKDFHINHHQRSYGIDSYQRMAPTEWRLDSLILSGGGRVITIPETTRLIRNAGTFLNSASTVCPNCGQRGGDMGVAMPEETSAAIRIEEYEQLMHDDSYWVGNMIENNEIVARFVKEEIPVEDLAEHSYVLPFPGHFEGPEISSREVPRNEIRLDIPSVFSFRYVRDNVTQNYFAPVGDSTLQHGGGLELSDSTGHMIACFPNFRGLYGNAPDNLEIQFEHADDGTELKVQSLVLNQGRRTWHNDVRIVVSGMGRRSVEIECPELVCRGFCFKIQLVTGNIVISGLRLQTKNVAGFLKILHWPDGSIVLHEISPARDGAPRFFGIQSPRKGDYGILPGEFLRLAHEFGC